MITATLHMGNIIQAFKDMKKDINFEMRRVMSWQMALVLQNVMINTGVKIDAEGDTGKSLGGGSSKLPAQRRHQLEVINAQLNRLFAAPPKGWDFKPTGKSGDVCVSKDKKSFWLDAEHHGLSFATMKKVHREHRGKYGQTLVRLPPKKVGNKTYGQRFYAQTASVLKEYIKSVQSRIGITKASWNYALEYFTAKSGGYAKWKPPSWVTRHGRMFGGTATEQFNEQEMYGTWIAGTNVPWYKDLNLGGKISFAIRQRMSDINQGFALKKLVGIMKKHAP